jgi:hypothetical protein
MSLKSPFHGLFVMFLIIAGCRSNDRINHEFAKKGEDLFSNYGCKICHSVSGEIMYGPPLNDIMNKQVEVVRKGSKTWITTDQDYLLRSVRDPSFEKVTGYENKTMPKPDISEKEIEFLVEYIQQINRVNQKK